jgi:RimJ/RimL family protein N-acetyltransferase
MDSITFFPLHPDDIDTLLTLAHSIWHAHYPGIISVEQIDYMLDRGYTRDIILDELEHQGIKWFIIRDRMTMIGFISVGPYGDGIMKLHKLYLLPEYHGNSIGTRALAMIEQVAKLNSAAKLVLNVNRYNQKAIRAYQRAGWHVEDEVIVDIGSGYVMNDYVMAKQLT